MKITGLIKMVKKIYEETWKKIANYKTIANFYERNREARFQNKIGLKKIAEEIDLELDKTQTADNLKRLKIIRESFSYFI